MFIEASAPISRSDDVGGRECVGACYRELLHVTVRNLPEITVGQLEVLFYEFLLG